MVTKAEFARRRGVTAQAVTLWIERGHLTPPALLPDGRIDSELAIEQLRERLDLARSSTQLDGDAGAGEGPGTLVERERRQRIEERELRLARLRREELASRGIYVRAADAQREWGRQITQLVAALDAWVPTELPARLGLDKQTQVAIRAEWRAWRERYARELQAFAAALPEFVVDSEEGEQ